MAYRFRGLAKADLGASYTLPLGGEARSLRFFGYVDNLFDREYFESGFRTPGRTGRAGAIVCLLSDGKGGSTCAVVQLVEGEDYYLEHGLMVLTARYHLRAAIVASKAAVTAHILRSKDKAGRMLIAMKNQVKRRFSLMLMSNSVVSCAAATAASECRATTAAHRFAQSQRD